MTTDLELFRAIVTNIVDEPPLGKRLVEADRWARAFAFARLKPSGGRIGLRRDGVASAIKFARSLLMRLSRPKVVAKNVMHQFTPDGIVWCDKFWPNWLPFNAVTFAPKVER